MNATRRSRVELIGDRGCARASVATVRAHDADLIRVGCCLVGTFALPCSVFSAKRRRHFALEGWRSEPLSAGSGIIGSWIVMETVLFPEALTLRCANSLDSR